MFSSLFLNLIPGFGTILFKLILFGSIFHFFAYHFFGVNYVSHISSTITTLFTSGTALVTNMQHYLNYVFYFIPYDMLKPLISLVIVFWVLRLIFAMFRLVGEAV